jgi:hypothetical protein
MARSPLVRTVVFGVALGLAIVQGCAKQGEGERCEPNAALDSDCDDGLICVDDKELLDNTGADDFGRCCPPIDEAISDSRCNRVGGLSGTAGTGGMTAEGGAAGSPSMAGMAGDAPVSGGAGGEVAAGGMSSGGAGGEPVAGASGAGTSGASAGGAPAAGGQGGAPSSAGAGGA